MTPRDGEALVLGQVMIPPEGFLEQAVARGIAIVAAEEALVEVHARRRAENDAPKIDDEDLTPVTVIPISVR